jgi:RNA-binding protein
MITSKQRAALRCMANEIPAIFQIGKDGINENLVKQLDDALTARELVKITILQNSSTDPKAAISELCESLNAEPVQCIGRKMVLYRRSIKNPGIEI